MTDEILGEDCRHSTSADTKNRELTGARVRRAYRYRPNRVSCPRSKIFEVNLVTGQCGKLANQELGIDLSDSINQVAIASALLRCNVPLWPGSFYQQLNFRPNWRQNDL